MKVQLEPGDILLYRTGSFIGWMIRCFDGAKHNHAAIWDGCTVIEMDAPGVVRQEFIKSANNSSVDIYRHLEGTLANPAVKLAEKFWVEGHRYAYGQILLLAPLTRLRHCRWKWLGRLFSRWAERNSQRLINAFDGSREPMICSELVYRCYDKKIVIKETDEVYPDLVTPGDLEESPNLKWIGKLA